MKNLFIVFLLTCVAQGLYAQTPIKIRDARLQALGSTVTVEGISTNGSELGGIRYLQDSTGAVPAFPGTGSQANFSTAVSRGTIVRVTGVLKSYNNLLEIDPITSYTVISNGNALPTPLAITPNGVNEANEAVLVKANNVRFLQAGGTFAVGNFEFTDGTETSRIYIRTGQDLIGQVIPNALVNITGLSAQFSNLYQLLPRNMADVQIVSSFYIIGAVTQSNISSTGFDLAWATNLSGNTQAKYGLTTALELGHTSVGANGTTHSLNLNGLSPATFYYVRPYSVNGADTAWANTGIYSTASTSSGTIEVYFNHSVATSFSTGVNAQSKTGAELLNMSIAMVDAATLSVDACLYNNDRDDLVRALERAKQRGVVVRYITDDATANTALDNVTYTFNVARVNTAALMHNKFIVTDYSLPSAKVWTGSMNFTSGNMTSDPNNTLIIHDQSLAKAYKMEFDEMWGSTTAVYSSANSKVGANKTDNTPHLFKIGGITVESYFSPSDKVTNRLVNVVNSANTDLSIGMLSFTRDELGNAVKDKIATTNERLIIESCSDTGSECAILTAANANLYEHTLPGQFHHKYCIVDATNTGSNPTVATGSHNWSSAAENSNDENTLIIYDASIANQFQQEFEARWCEVTGTSCTINIQKLPTNLPFRLQPNPANDYITIFMDKDDAYELILTDAVGRVLRAYHIQNNQTTIPVNDLPKGFYTLTVRNEQGINTQKIIIE